MQLRLATSMFGYIRDLLWQHNILANALKSLLGWDNDDDGVLQWYTISTVVLILAIALYFQLSNLESPPTVPGKVLPKRPTLRVSFHPEEPTTRDQKKVQQSGQVNDSKQQQHGIASSNLQSLKIRKQAIDPLHENDEVDFDQREGIPMETVSINGPPNVNHSGSLNEDFVDAPNIDAATTTASDSSPEPPLLYSTDLPDSFAPLLSSSHTKVYWAQVTPNIVHASRVNASVAMLPGKHELPLNLDLSRPQLAFDIPAINPCVISASAHVGTHGWTTAQDLDLNVHTSKRSKPIVQHAHISIEPPLPLLNVAPTLIHFPTLFDDRWWLPTLRRLPIIKTILVMIVSAREMLEKFLWILEAQCQIHLSKVKVTPYHRQGSPSQKFDSSWRLQLAFSGHVQMFGLCPIPFYNVVLPSFIIPQPHALLEALCTTQPLASAKLHRERLNQERIILAALGAAERWNVDATLVAATPAVHVDVTLPGGLTLALYGSLGKDVHVGREQETFAATRNAGQEAPIAAASVIADDNNSLSSWTTRPDQRPDFKGSNMNLKSSKVSPDIFPDPIYDGMLKTTSTTASSSLGYDINHTSPWLVEFKAQGTISEEKLSVHVTKFSAKQQPSINNAASRFGTRGSLAIWRTGISNKQQAKANSDQRVSRSISIDRENMSPLRQRLSNQRSSSPLSARPFRRQDSVKNRPALEYEDTTSVASILLFPDDSIRSKLHYDYAFDVFEDSRIDTVTLAVGASHPMLNGGSLVTVILDSIFAHGSMTAREGSVFDPEERRRKRNILRHLPAIDFSFGIQNVYIPPESNSYSDDGQTLFLPDIEGGRLKARILGGLEGEEIDGIGRLSPEGIHLMVDFGVSSVIVKTEGAVNEFPELDIFEDSSLLMNIAGVIGGSIRAHLRPQKLGNVISSSLGPNVFNPLEAYEVDFSKSNLSLKFKEFIATLGHRRVIFPTESSITVDIVESVVDMGCEGKTQCELGWDFQGLSPILQVAPLGQSPEAVVHNEKKQVSLLVSPLRQGRLSFHVSSVGGIQVKKAATLREDAEGLFDWKFFNALVSPNEESGKKIMDVLHDKWTMKKMLQIIELINGELHKVLKYTLQQVWRAKEIFDKEGVSDPGHAIPMYKMARLLSLFLRGNVDLVDEVLPLVQNVVLGEGLDVTKVKDLLRENIEHYDEWAPEIDRAVRWAAMLMDPMTVGQPLFEDNLIPLSEQAHHAAKFRHIPSAAQLYDQIVDKPQLSLDPAFSNLVGRIAPFLSFRQIQFFLEFRASTDWQPSDLRRLRYVYSIKRKVLDIAESYGGLSFLPQSFLVSVFLGEATRTSLRAKTVQKSTYNTNAGSVRQSSKLSLNPGGMSSLRRRRTAIADTATNSSYIVTNADGRYAFRQKAGSASQASVAESVFPHDKLDDSYDLGDSLLGPQDVAILLQSGLTSVMKGSTVVQLNQRMLLDLICSQPRSFAVAVLAEIGSPGGQGSPRSLTSALMSLLELDQSAFKVSHRVSVHSLLESWLPEVRIPKREDYMAGGRWARQSYYEALFAVATSILEDAESYIALKGHIQRMRRQKEADPIPGPREEIKKLDYDGFSDVTDRKSTKLLLQIQKAKAAIFSADEVGSSVVDLLLEDEVSTKQTNAYQNALRLYDEAFEECKRVLAMDKYAFQSDWFRTFFKRNYDALMVKSLYDNVVDDVDRVRYWLQVLHNNNTSSKGGHHTHDQINSPTIVDTPQPNQDVEKDESSDGLNWEDLPSSIANAVNKTKRVLSGDNLFMTPDFSKEQRIVEAIIDAVFYEEFDRHRLKSDPLVRLLISNKPGHYNFTIVSAMGVVTEGKRGTELKDAFARLKEKRGVEVVRADTGTARSFEYNANKIIEAVEIANQLKRPYGLLGYSQGCANALMAETILLSGSPKQQQLVKGTNSGLVCRQLLFAAANGSFHGPSVERKIQKLFVLCEEFFKYQQGYVSRALASTVLESLTVILDSAHFHKFMGGANSFLPEGSRAFWREAQHLAHVPTCTLRGVLEKHTTPESLELMSNLLTKQSNSPLHDSQVHVFDAVGHPVYYSNRNGRLLKRCDIGEGAIQRTHHWSPLNTEVGFLATAKDDEQASFDCAKDRHIFPWVDVNARFGFIKYTSGNKIYSNEVHPNMVATARRNVEVTNTKELNLIETDAYKM